jgi:membrane-bound ClpP family serine protease
MPVFALLTLQTPVQIRIEGPLHGIHREMLANALRQTSGRVSVVARDPEAALELSQRLPADPRVAFAGRPVDGAAEYRPTWRERIVLLTLDPNVAFPLLAAGLLLIYAEFCRPGLVLPGAFGGVVTMLALYGLAASRIRLAGALLLLAAAAAFTLSAFLESRGVLGLAGGVAMAAGAILLIDAPAPYRIRIATAIAVSIPFALVTTVLTEIAVRARTNKTVEQIDPVVFSSSTDISSTISVDSGHASGRRSTHAERARRT